MRKFLTFALCLALAGPAVAQDQKATDAQATLLTEIAKCLAAGLPPDWDQAEMSVELKSPGAETGDVSYLVRRKLAGGQFEPFRPCDPAKAARQLVVEMRKLQPAERRGWIEARLVLMRDGRFDLHLEYPEAKGGESKAKAKPAR